MIEYIAKHGLESKLNALINQCATDKPADGKPAPGASSEQSATTEQMPAGRAGDDGDGHGHGDGDGGGR